MSHIAVKWWSVGCARLVGSVLALVVFAASALDAQTIATVAGEPLTLDAAIAMALAANRQLQSTALEIAKADEEVALARVNRYPQLSIDAQAAQRLTNISFAFPAGSFGTFESTGPIPATDTEITTPRRPIFFAYGTVAQPLTQLFRINLSVKAAEVGRELERDRARGTAQTVVANVRSLYYSLLQTESALRASGASIEVSRELQRVMRERAGRQAVLDADVTDAELRLAQADQGHLELMHALAAQKEQLNQLLGRDVRTAFTTVPLPDVPAAASSLDDAISRAQAARADVREARRRIEQADLDRRIKQSEAIPDVSFTLTYFSLFNTDVLPRNLASAGLQLSWEPFDWGRRRREAAQKASSLQQARIALQDAEARVAVEVLSAVRRLDEVRGQLRVAKLTQDAARERLRVRTEQLSVQAALPADVLQAQAQLADADAKHQQAIATYWISRAELDRALGEDVKP